MNKISKILIGSNNKGKFREIADLLPQEIKKISPYQLNIESPEETGKTFTENFLTVKNIDLSLKDRVCEKYKTISHFVVAT